MFQNLWIFIALVPTEAFGVEDASAWSMFLKDAGGWGVAIIEGVVLGGVIGKLWMELKAQAAAHALENKAKDDRLFTMLDKQNETLKLSQGLMESVREIKNEIGRVPR